MKVFSTGNNIGKAKYVVNYHDGVRTHKDGSLFFDIHICKNKVERERFINKLVKNGYIINLTKG